MNNEQYYMYVQLRYKHTYKIKVILLLADAVLHDSVKFDSIFVGLKHKMHLSFWQDRELVWLGLVGFYVI